MSELEQKTLETAVVTATPSNTELIIIYPDGDVEVGNLASLVIKHAETGVKLGSYRVDHEGVKRFAAILALPPFNDEGITSLDYGVTGFQAFMPIYEEWTHKTLAEMLLAKAEHRDGAAATARCRERVDTREEAEAEARSRFVAMSLWKKPLREQAEWLAENIRATQESVAREQRNLTYFTNGLACVDHSKRETARCEDSFSSTGLEDL